jgi:antitoxin ParD1/3/4
MPRKSRPITVTLGDLQEHVETRVKSGAYASASEVMRAAVRALDREEAALDDWLRQRVDEALADPRPTVPARDVFARLRRHRARQAKAGRAKTARNEKI